MPDADGTGTLRMKTVITGLSSLPSAPAPSRAGATKIYEEKITTYINNNKNDYHHSDLLMRANIL